MKKNIIERLIRDTEINITWKKAELENEDSEDNKKILEEDIADMEEDVEELKTVQNDIDALDVLYDLLGFKVRLWFGSKKHPVLAISKEEFYDIGTAVDDEYLVHISEYQYDILKKAIEGDGKEQAEILESTKKKLENQSAKEKAFDILSKHFDIQVGHHPMFGHWVFLESSDENSPQQSDLTNEEAEIIKKASGSFSQ